MECGNETEDARLACGKTEGARLAYGKYEDAKQRLKRWYKMVRTVYTD
jgi:hypothetical protein